MKGRGYSFWIWLCIVLCLSTVNAYSASNPTFSHSAPHSDQIQPQINNPNSGVLDENSVDFSSLTDGQSVRLLWDKNGFGYSANCLAEKDLDNLLFRRFELAPPLVKFRILIFPFHTFW